MKTVLDVCCGGRMFYWDKHNENVVYGDIRIARDLKFSGNRTVDVNPDLQMDFKNLPFKSSRFNLVIFDPPHLEHAGDSGYQTKKYGKLRLRWRTDFKAGFDECWRVLKVGGTLIFKWNETQFSVTEVLSCFPIKPLLGQRRTNNLKTHWLVFHKFEN